MVVVLIWRGSFIVHGSLDACRNCHGPHTDGVWNQFVTNLVILIIHRIVVSRLISMV